MMEFYNHGYPIAKKEHKCEYCRGKIKKGEKYSYETGKYNGDMFTRKLCITCEKILKDHIESSGDNEFSWDGVDDWLHDQHCYGCADKDTCDAIARRCDKVRATFN